MPEYGRIFTNSRCCGGIRFRHSVAQSRLEGLSSRIDAQYTKGDHMQYGRRQVVLREVKLRCICCTLMELSPDLRNIFFGVNALVRQLMGTRRSEEKTPRAGLPCGACMGKGDKNMSDSTKKLRNSCKGVLSCHKFSSTDSCMISLFCTLHYLGGESEGKTGGGGGSKESPKFLEEYSNTNSPTTALKGYTTVAAPSSAVLPPLTASLFA